MIEDKPVSSWALVLVGMIVVVCGGLTILIKLDGIPLIVSWLGILIGAGLIFERASRQAVQARAETPHPDDATLEERSGFYKLMAIGGFLVLIVVLIAMSIGVLK